MRRDALVAISDTTRPGIEPRSIGKQLSVDYNLQPRNLVTDPKQCQLPERKKTMYVLIELELG